MGLSGPRKRQKISHDPNNTKWSRDTTTFGHRILASQGWVPGQTLGSGNAAHAKHFTKASASHVRITLRDDNLGLGAKVGSGQGPGECTGLDSFQDLLGRLNGKTEAVIEKERRGRADVNRLLYAERKYGGFSRFVSAGYLVGGESIQDKLDTTSSVEANKAATADHVCNTSSKDVKSLNLDKKRKKKIAEDEQEQNNLPMATVYQVELGEEARSKSQRQAEKAERRAEKAQKKENRQKKREEKAARKAKEQSLEASGIHSSEPIARSITSTTTSGSVTPSSAGNRHAVRARYIMQKKQAMLDPKALSEILMVKV